MATAIVAQAPFEPLFDKPAVLENLSSENCRERDTRRRVGALICTRTAQQLLDSASDDPRILCEMLEQVADLKLHVEGEVEILRFAIERVEWALEQVGVSRLPARS